MNRISPYQTAAILILARLLSLSLYQPLPGENTALTAVCALLLCALKWLLLFPAVKLISDRPLFRSRSAVSAVSLLTVTGAAVLIAVLTDSLASLLEAVSPGRLPRFGVTAVMLFICAYTASMGRQALARAASLMLPVFIALGVLSFFELRSAMLPDRLSLYSPDPLRGTALTLRRLLGGSADLFLAVTLVPLTRQPKQRSAGVYLAADALISLGFFLMSRSVLGSFESSSGSLWFTLAACTHGSVIDRSTAVFLAVASACAAVTLSALLLVMCRSLSLLTPRPDMNVLLICSAAVLAILLLAAAARDVSVSLLSEPACTAVSALALASAFVSPLFSRRKESP